MTYQRLDYESMLDPAERQVFKRAETYLSDVYSIDRYCDHPPGVGAGNYVAAFSLFCLIDGLATEVEPKSRKGLKGYRVRFEILVTRRLPGGPVGEGQWVDKKEAASHFWRVFRGPLVHGIAADSGGRSPEEGEPTIGKSGSVPVEFRDIERIERMTAWNDGWPIYQLGRCHLGRRRHMLSVVGLYWSVKKLARDLVSGRR